MEIVFSQKLVFSYFGDPKEVKVVASVFLSCLLNQRDGYSGGEISEISFSQLVSFSLRLFSRFFLKITERITAIERSFKIH